jgi:hypothetical protein
MRKKTKTAAKAKKGKVKVASKVLPRKSGKKCAYPTTLFEVEFPTTVLFWSGVALFFFLILFVAKNII